MPAKSKIVRLNAKATLKDKWTSAVIVSAVFLGVCLFGTLCGGLLYNVGGVFLYFIFSFLFLVFLTIPLFLGTLDYFRAMAFGECVRADRLFIPFSDAETYTRYLTFSLSLFVRLFVAFFVLSLPSSITRVLASSEFYTNMGLSVPVWTTALSAVSSLLFAIAFVLFAVFILKYFMAPFLFVSNRDLSAKEAINLSKIMTIGHRFEFVKLIFSLIFYIIISLFLIPLFFTMPYFMTCYVVNCRFVVFDYNKRIKESMNV
ncbi:MAG: DUF975 family protein [Clostridia bacterium]|nr:DUF975 family protein [Clostridia bacterium]